MISFNYELDFKLSDEKSISQWISSVITLEELKEGEINYIFCNDEYLHKLNLEFLKHDSYTDIISFDYIVGKELHGDIYISIERVEENAKDFSVSFDEELMRVLIHGVLHYCGYKDKSDEDIRLIREKENFYLGMLSLNR